MASVKKGYLLFIFCSVEDRSNMHYKYNKRKKSIKTMAKETTTTTKTTTNEHLDNGIWNGMARVVVSLIVDCGGG